MTGTTDTLYQGGDLSGTVVLDGEVNVAYVYAKLEGGGGDYRLQLPR